MAEPVGEVARPLLNVRYISLIGHYNNSTFFLHKLLAVFMGHYNNYVFVTRSFLGCLHRRLQELHCFAGAPRAAEELRLVAFI